MRRDGFKITNAGRSPIEHVDVPAIIPKAIRRFYSGAIVAHQSGQTLAALFLLRTVIEQWSRILTGTPAVLADQVLHAYMDSLPVDFKGRFASMRALYDRLSSDLHAATGSGELFDTARAQIAEHFEARRLFGLTANGPATLTRLNVHSDASAGG